MSPVVDRPNSGRSWISREINRLKKRDAEQRLNRSANSATRLGPSGTSSLPAGRRGGGGNGGGAVWL